MSDNPIELWRAAWPPLFAGTELDRLSGNALRWRTTQNRRCRREIPDDCFCRHGTKTLIRRDPFLDVIATEITDAREPLDNPPPRSRRNKVPAPAEPARPAEPALIAAAPPRIREIG